MGRPTEEILDPPYHPYTEALLSAVPVVGKALQRSAAHLVGETPSPEEELSGCPFHTRCPLMLGEICRTTQPPWEETVSGHGLFCHIPRTELTVVQRPVFTAGEREGT